MARAARNRHRAGNLNPPVKMLQGRKKTAANVTTHFAPSDEEAKREARASRVLEFVTRCYAAIGLKLPNYQRELILELYGKQHPDGRRIYRWLYFSVPRKNAKTTMVAAIALYHLFADGEARPRIFIAALSLEQTKETFEIMVAMIEALPSLDSRTKIHDSENRKEITRLSDDGRRKVGYVRALTKGGKGKHGKNPSCVIFDELHMWGESERELWTAMTTGSKARKQPMFLITTTAGVQPVGLCHEQYERAKNLIRGAIEDPTYLPYIAEAQEADDWQDERTWIEVNPLVKEGFIPVENIRADFYQTIGNPQGQALFKRTQLNMWGQDADCYLPMDRWRAQSGTVDDTALIDRTCYAGLDLSQAVDFSSLVLVFPELMRDEKGRTLQSADKSPLYRYLVKCYVWTPEGRLEERERETGAPLRQWVEAGHLLTCEGDYVSYHQIFKKLQEISSVCKVKEIAYDPYNAKNLTEDAEAAGFTCVEFRQGYLSMNLPTKWLLQLVLDRRLVHGNNPCLTWQAGQLVVEPDHIGNLRPSRKKRKHKVDAMVALVMALGRAQFHHRRQGKPINPKALKLI